MLQNGHCNVEPGMKNDKWSSILETVTGIAKQKFAVHLLVSIEGQRMEGGSMPIYPAQSVASSINSCS